VPALIKTHFLAIIAVICAVDADHDASCLLLLVKDMRCHILVSCLHYDRRVCVLTFLGDAAVALQTIRKRGRKMEEWNRILK